MTFDEASRVIKRGDIVHLRKELEEGLGPNLCNQYSWTLLMIAAMEGDTSIGRLLIEKGATLTDGTSIATRLSPSQRTPAIRRSLDCCWRVALLWNATHLETPSTFG
jgi:ankyrin repeat protein